MNNSRFAISMHILTLLAHEDGEWLSSDYIAGSININPVLVRKELSNLRQHGLVQSREGKNGGSCLAKPAARILLSEVFEAIRSESSLGTTKNDPNPDCKIGRQINKHLGNLYEEVDQVLVQKLSKTTLASFYKDFKV